MKKLVIIGAGGLGREAMWCATTSYGLTHHNKILGFVDDTIKKVDGNKVLGDLNWFKENNLSDIVTICAIGEPRIRKLVVERAQKMGVAFTNLVHPSVIMSDSIEMGKGNIIMPNNILTVNIKIGNHNYINLNNTIGHDCIIGNYCHIAPGCNISGNVHIDDGVYLGTNTSIIQGKRINKWSKIGANAAVINDILSNCVAVGVPAKIIEKKLNQAKKEAGK